MTDISFLHGAHDRIQSVAAWLALAAGAGRRVVVFAPAEEYRQQLDRLLWAVPPTGFIPHCPADDKLAAETPIVLATTLDSSAHDECLVNLSDEVPPGFGRFRELVEIVSSADRDKLPGRERYRFYRERGYPLQARDISQDLQ